MKIIVTGGSGFIGSNLIKYLIHKKIKVLNIDCGSYASKYFIFHKNIKSQYYLYKKININNKKKISTILNSFQPDKVMNLAAETHVDRSIENSDKFISSNIVGTHNLLKEVTKYWKKLKGRKKNNFRFHQVSTDEVYGDLKINDNPFNEMSSYKPSSPYSASKASSDHLVSAWYRTYGLPILISYSSNNYGPMQHPEKLIPKIIFNAINGKKIPIYGNGKQIRDWIYVEDHVNALFKIIKKGKVGEKYNIGSSNEMTNIGITNKICKYLELKFKKMGKNKKFINLITYVDDRLGHDFRYAINSNKIQKNLKWKSKMKFDDGLKKTIEWYIKYFNLEKKNKL